MVIDSNAKMNAAKCFGTCIGETVGVAAVMSKTLGFAYIYMKTKSKFGTVAALATLAGLEIIWHKGGKTVASAIRHQPNGSEVQNSYGSPIIFVKGL